VGLRFLCGSCVGGWCVGGEECCFVRNAGFFWFGFLGGVFCLVGLGWVVVCVCSVGF